MQERFLGIEWGENTGTAAERLGLRCNEWQPWEGGNGYDACFETDHPLQVFGRPALARLFRIENRLEGITLRFMRCGEARESLAAEIRRTFQIEDYSGSPYNIFSDGSLVRFDYDSGDDTCQLTVAGPHFGNIYAQYVLGRGLSGLNFGPR